MTDREIIVTMSEAINRIELKIYCYEYDGYIYDIELDTSKALEYLTDKLYKPSN